MNCTNDDEFEQVNNFYRKTVSFTSFLGEMKVKK